ncbi:MAG: DUF998 domain-containing protein [Acidobacteria bacterium]|nr:DUF998 domain-containing protein [Acidobacteriota bacterium]
MRSFATRILGAAGIAAGVAWAGAVIGCGAIRPGYNPVSQFVSELAERGSSTEAVMRITGFGVPGLLVVAFAAFLLVRSAGPIVAVVLIIHGVGRLTAGVFPCDPGCPASGASVSQAVHNAAAMMNGLTLLAAAVFCAVRMWRIGRNGFALYSLVSAIAGSAFLVLMFMDVTTRTYVGLFQRLAFGVLHVWLAAFALSMRPWAIESTLAGRHI